MGQRRYPRDDTKLNHVTKHVVQGLAVKVSAKSVNEIIVARAVTSNIEREKKN